MTKKKVRKKSKNIKKTRRKIKKFEKSRKTRPIKKSRKSKRSKSKKIRKINFKAPIYSKDSDGNSIIKVSDSWANYAYVNESKYTKKYKLSIKENDKFGLKKEKNYLDKKYTKIKDVKYGKDEVKIKWFYDGTLNASAIVLIGT